MACSEGSLYKAITSPFGFVWACLAVAWRQNDSTLCERFGYIYHTLVTRPLITSRCCFLFLYEWAIDKYVDVLKQSEFFTVIYDFFKCITCIGHNMVVVNSKQDRKIDKLICLIKRFPTTECDVFTHRGSYFTEYFFKRHQLSARIVMCLRIMTPMAVPATSLKKDSCPQARPVDDGVINDTCYPET